jgi:hypothetical protein
MIFSILFVVAYLIKPIYLSSATFGKHKKNHKMINFYLCADIKKNITIWENIFRISTLFIFSTHFMDVNIWWVIKKIINNTADNFSVFGFFANYFNICVGLRKFVHFYLDSHFHVLFIKVPIYAQKG